MKKDQITFIKWFFSIIAPKWYIKKRFVDRHNFKPNFKNPIRHTEKVVLRKFNYTKEMSRLSDKISVRDYVKKIIGEKYLVPVYAIINNLTETAFDNLPNSFVIKANHGSGYNLIVRDKSNYTYRKLKTITDTWLKDKYYLIGMELHYKDIKPRLIVEKLLLNKKGAVPYDYKAHYFKNGNDPKIFIGVHVDRFSDYCYNYYDKNWKSIKNPWKGEEDFYEDKITEKPVCLDEMLEITKKLAESYNYLRVDFYIHENKIYFGELTFTPNGGAITFKTKEIDECLGSMW